MAWSPKAKPTAIPGRPVARDKAFIWATHLAKALGADVPCWWAGWFKAHFQHFKVERDAENLPIWNREHNELMKAKRVALERQGWRCEVEDVNKFTIRGKTADVAGKPDLVAFADDQVVVVDGKTGRPRESDAWQVRIYIYGLQLSRPALGTKDVSGLVHYAKANDRAIANPSLEEIQAIEQGIRTMGAPTAPERSPSEWQCGRCDIHIADCPKRWQESQRLTAATTRF